MPQLTVAELRLIDQLTRTQKGSGADAWRQVNAARLQGNIDPVSIAAVHNYIKGRSHQRGKAERRGQGQRVLNAGHVRKLMSVRRRLIQKADGARRVTYADVTAEAKLDVDCSPRTIQDAMRAEGISYLPARGKIQVTEGDAKARLAFAEGWYPKPPSFWTNSIHGFLDCKTWVVPLTPAQRKRYSQTRVVGHLRLPSEGADRGFTKPRQKHAWIGIPSVNIAAVVSGDRIIVFKEVEGSWNGDAARRLYTDIIAPVLRRHFPNKRTRTRSG
jgi:hypothetical protein